MNATVRGRIAPRGPIRPRDPRQLAPVRAGRVDGGGAAVARRLAFALVVAAALGGCTAPTGAGDAMIVDSPRAAAGTHRDAVARPGDGPTTRANGAATPGDGDATPGDGVATFAPLPPAAFDADFVLLGEVHDNVAQHRLRLRWLETLADAHPFALALEQFDADRQAELDRARAIDAEAVVRGTQRDLATRAHRIAESAGFDFDGWNWALYRPAIELALRGGLPLFAANLSPADTARVARGTAPPAPPPPGWGEEEAEAMRASIREGHCGLLPERAVDAMALAQRTRDARIARALVEAHERSGLPVVLLAGNGHLRRDIGVPRHLAALRPHDRVASIALLERADAVHAGDERIVADSDRPPFDIVIRTAAQAREDPCAGLRGRMQRRPQ